MPVRFDFRTFPLLETERLSLREIIEEDIPALFDLFSDPQVTQYNDVVTFRSEHDAEMLLAFMQERYRRRDGLRWAITRKDDPDSALIGTGGYNIWSRHNNCAGIGYDLLHDCWNQGMMTEAIGAMVGFGFNEMGLNRIEADVMVGNPASARVLEKNGFIEEGVLHQRGYWKGKYHDLRLFALLRVEYTLKTS